MLTRYGLLITTDIPHDLEDLFIYSFIYRVNAEYKGLR